MISSTDMNRLFSLLTPENQQKVLDYMEMLSAEQELSLIAGDGNLDENLDQAVTVQYFPEEEDEELKRFMQEAGRMGRQRALTAGLREASQEEAEDPELQRFLQGL